MNSRQSHGDGKYDPLLLKFLGKETVIEDGVRIFNPGKVCIHNKVYIGHDTILNGYFLHELIIDEGTWIGQYCFIHAAGGIYIGKSVGIAPYVKILTSIHKEESLAIPVIDNPMVFKKVQIFDGADIGIGAIILPGVTIAEGSIIGAGSVVNKDTLPYSVYAGTPAKYIRKRRGE